MKAIKAWAGVCDSEIKVELWPNTHNDSYDRLYATKGEALKHYESVVLVLVLAAAEPSSSGETK